MHTNPNPIVVFQESYQRAATLLRTYHREHKRLAEALLEHETLSAEQIELAIKGKKIKARQH